MSQLRNEPVLRLPQKGNEERRASTNAERKTSQVMRGERAQTRINRQQLFQNIRGQDEIGIRMAMMQMINPKRPAETNTQGRSSGLGDMTMQDDRCTGRLHATPVLAL